jgi:tripartite-type tricarboxylate transporter receptor subunit TctC
VILYKPGGDGGPLWSQIDTLPADGPNVVGIELPQIVMQPLTGQATYRTENLVPVYWFHVAPDTLVVPEASPVRTAPELVQAAKDRRLKLAGETRHGAAQVAVTRFTGAFGIAAEYVPFERAGELTTAMTGGQVDGAMTSAGFALQRRGRVRALAVATEARHPLLPDVPTFRELGVDWTGGTYRGIAMPSSTPEPMRKRISDLWAALSADPEAKETAERLGIEPVNVGLDAMDAFMKDRSRVYTAAARRMGLVP